MLQNPSLNPFFKPTRNQILVALGLGFIVLIIVTAHLVIPLSTGIVTDPRELFTTIGAALTGPFGALIIGIMAGIREPNGLELTSIMAHVIGLLWVGFAYKWLYLRFESVSVRVGLWALVIVVYYTVFVVPGFVIGMRLFNPDIYAAAMGDVSVWEAYTHSIPTAMPEMILTALVTSVAWLALPKRYRKPLW